MTPNEKKIDKVFADAAVDTKCEYEPPYLRRMAKGPHRYAAAIELDFTRLNGRRGYWDRTGRMQGITVRLGIPSYGEEDEEYAQNCLDTMVEIAAKLGIPVKRSYKRLQSTIHGPIYNCYVIVPQYEPQAETKPEASDEVDESGASSVPAVDESTKITLTLKQIKKLVKESWPKDIEYDDEEIDMVDEPKKSDKDGEQKSPTTNRAKEIRKEIREIKKERAEWIQQSDEEYERYQRFEDRAGWVTRARANKIRDGFAEREAKIRSHISDCNARLKALNKELKDLVK